MEIYLSLLFLVSPCSAIQFNDDSENLGQSQRGGNSGFFPADDAPDERYSEISGISYIEPQNFFESSNSENRKQLNFNGNLPRPPQDLPQFQPGQYILHPPVMTPVKPANINAIRKRPQFPYQYVKPSNYYNSMPQDLKNPFYQNYANYYQHPQTQSSTSYPHEYYNPTRYPSKPNANLYGQNQLLQHQASLQYPNYYTNNYANQFGYQRPSQPSSSSPIYGENANGLSSFFSNIRESNGPLGQLTQVGGQFSKALEDISINDDLQCVPKLLCSMIRNPRRPNQLPSFMNVPGLTAIISALPSSSPIMNFGRAALLGLSGGECDAAYPRCPRDEDGMLYYLNNHRGGFFRFFNGGNSFGDENYLQQQQQQVNQQQVAGASQGLNLLALQALADAINQQGNGINLSNLFTSPSTQSPVQNYQGLQADQSQTAGLLSLLKPSTISDVVSNLLTGVVGNRFSRRLNKRSLPDENTIIESGQREGRQHKITKRIVNLKDASAPFIVTNNQQQTTLYDVDAPFKFSNEKREQQQLNTNSVIENGLKFPQEISSTAINQATQISSADIGQRLQMLFPDRTGTGNLRFDSEQFDRELLLTELNNRIAKILAGVMQRPINNNYQDYNNQNYQKQPPQYSSAAPQYQSNYAGTGSSNYNNNNYNNRGQQNHSGQKHIVYVTNAQGQIEYTLNELTGEKQRYQ